MGTNSHHFDSWSQNSQTFKDLLKLNYINHFLQTFKVSKMAHHFPQLSKTFIVTDWEKKNEKKNCNKLNSDNGPLSNGEKQKWAH